MSRLLSKSWLRAARPDLLQAADRRDLLRCACSGAQRLCSAVTHTTNSEEMFLFRRHSVPLILCNYGGFYDGLIRFFKSCDTNETLAARELKDIILADSNDEVTPVL